MQLEVDCRQASRRNVVATNQGGGGWSKVLAVYKSRKVLFVVKNDLKIVSEDYRQASSLLSGEFGALAFIVCRDPEHGLRRGTELETYRDLYAKGIVIVKVQAQQLVTVLSKLRNPEKVDAGDLMIDRVLDAHVRMYASDQMGLSGDGAVAKKKRR